MISVSLQVQELRSPNVDWTTPQNGILVSIETFIYFTIALPPPTLFLCRVINVIVAFCHNYSLFTMQICIGLYYGDLNLAIVLTLTAPAAIPHNLC